MHKAPHAHDAHSQTGTHWLVLSHCFNMDGRAASQVIADKIPMLIAKGITPIVISAPMGRRATTHPHIQAFAVGPSALRFDARHLLSERIGRGVAYRVLTGLLSLVLAPLIIVERLLSGLQNHASWTLSAIILGLRVIRRHQPTLIYTTGGAYSAHWAGYWLKRLTGVAWVAEVHDPMILPGQPLKNRNLRRIAKTEALICQHADLAWWLTRAALDSARQRHPEIQDRGFWVHSGAMPPMALRDAIATPGVIATPSLDAFHIGHFGSLSRSRNTGAFVQALASFVRRRPEVRSHLVIDLFGSDLDPIGRAAASAAGIEALFVFHGRLAHEAVFNAMERVDLLLLIHGSSAECSEYIPAKTFEYFWAHRPVLACTYRNTELDRLVLERNGYVAEGDNVESISGALEAAYLGWENDSWKPSDIAPISVESAVQTILDRISSKLAQSLPTPQPYPTA
jgi:glycosyltransferase involved in cell wall biosynthesis